MTIAIYDNRGLFAGHQVDEEIHPANNESGRMLAEFLAEGAPRLEGVVDNDVIVEQWAVEPIDSPFFGLALTTHLDHLGWTRLALDEEMAGFVKDFGDIPPVTCRERDQWFVDGVLQKHLLGQHDQHTHGHGRSGVGLSGVDTSSWNPKNSAAMWAKKKIETLEKLAADGDWDKFAKAMSKTKGGNSYLNGIKKAQSELLKLKEKQAQEPIKKSTLKTEEPQVATDAGWKALGGGALGTEVGGKYKGPDGKEYYVKQPSDAGRAHNEVLASKLYALSGVGCKDMNLVEIDGKLSVAGEWLDSKHSNWDDPAVLNKAQGDFAVHAWLANRDVIGAGSEVPMDNIHTMPNGDLKVIDPGGALEYKGMGGSGKKPKFGKDVSEWDGLRDPSINPSAAKVYGKMTPQQLIDSAKKLEAIDNKAVGELVQKYHGGSAVEKAALTAKLISRKQDVLAKAKALEAKMNHPKPKSPTVKEQVKHDIDAQFGADVKAGGKTKVAPSIPTPWYIKSKHPGNQSHNVKMEKLYAAAKKAAETGDLSELHAIKVKANSKNTYTKKVWQYKNQLLNTLQDGGKPNDKVMDTVMDDAVNVTKPKKSSKKIKIDVSEFPEKPEFITSNMANKASNEKKIDEIISVAASGDLGALQSIKLTPSPKVQAFHNEVVANVSSQLNPPPEPKYIKEADLSAAATIGKNLKGEKLAACEHVGYWAKVGELGVPIPKPTGTWTNNGKKKVWDKGAAQYDKMPPSYSDAVYSYTNGGYDDINAELRNGGNAKYALNAANAVKKYSHELEPGTMLSRKYKIQGSSAAHAKNLQNAVGHVVKEKGLLSTSTNKNKWSGNVHCNITVGHGCKGLAVKKRSAHSGENEVILPAGQNMLITSVTRIKKGTPGYANGSYKGQAVSIGHTVVEMLMLPTQDSQCCPP